MTTNESNDNMRLDNGSMEIGYTEALRKHLTRHVVPPAPVSQSRLDFEHRRPRIVQECVAEATGVFFYVFPGIISVAALNLNLASPVVTLYSSLFQVGLAFGLGIGLAITLCSPVSGGHFNPAVSLCFAIWGGFPWRKVPHYVLSQVFGAFLAGLALMGCYWPQIQATKDLDVKNYGTAAYNGGAASILCAFPPATQTNQGYLFLQEFICSMLVAIVIWACIDPANPFKTPASLTWTIGSAYALVIWGFGSQALSLNTARDLGTRIVAAIFFGGDAFTNYNFCWIPLLVNLPAYILGAGFYEYFFRDSLQSIGLGHAEHENGRAGVLRHLTSVGAVGLTEAVRGERERPETERGEIQYKATARHIDDYA